MREKVDTFLRVARTPRGDDSKVAAELYDHLVRRVEPYVRGKTRLLISPDDVLAFLPVAFYRAMRNQGLPPAQALRAAKLAMLRGGGERAHPFHWAPFVLWGRAR